MFKGVGPVLLKNPGPGTYDAKDHTSDCHSNVGKFKRTQTPGIHMECYNNGSTKYDRIPADAGTKPSPFHYQQNHYEMGTKSMKSTGK